MGPKGYFASTYRRIVEFIGLIDTAEIMVRASGKCQSGRE